MRTPRLVVPGKSRLAAPKSVREMRLTREPRRAPTGARRRARVGSPRVCAALGDLAPACSAEAAAPASRPASSPTQPGGALSAPPPPRPTRTVGLRPQCPPHPGQNPPPSRGTFSPRPQPRARSPSLTGRCVAPPPPSSAPRAVRDPGWSCHPILSPCLIWRLYPAFPTETHTQCWKHWSNHRALFTEWGI